MNDYTNYKRCVFTIITGGYDSIQEPDHSALGKGWDFICFTDTPELIESKYWDIRPIQPRDAAVKCPKRRANSTLMHYPDYLSDEYDICLYIDGNVKIKRNLDQFLSSFKYNPEEHDLMIQNHPQRKCIYQEANAIIQLAKDDRRSVDSHLKHLRDQKYPRNNGLYETNKMVITRKSEKTEELFDNWLSDYMKLPSKRDQMSLNYTIWRLNNGIKILSHSAPTGARGKDVRAFNNFLEIMPHNKNKAQPVTKNPEEDFIIFENTPFRVDKDLIKAYNSFMELLPENGWALFRDADTLFLDPFYGEVFERAIRNNPDAGCFTCLTNRIGCKEQLHEEYSGDDIVRHRKIADNLKNQNYNKYEDFQFDPSKSKALSGMVMLLSKKAWKQVGGFKKSTIPGHVHPRNKKYSNILGVDNQLHKDLKTKKIPLRIIKEMYVYHWYRGGGDDKSHLDANVEYKHPTMETKKVRPTMNAKTFLDKKKGK